jgi:hypothetical protein
VAKQHLIQLIIKGINGSDNALKGAQKQLKETGKAAEEMGKKFVSVGGAVTAALVGIVTATARSTDEMITQAQVLGLTTERYSKLAFAAGQTGFAQDKFFDAMRQGITNMSIARTGLGEAAGQFIKLGIDIENADGSLRSIDDVMIEVARNLPKLANETERTAAIVRIFGETGSGLIPILAEGEDAIRAYTERADELGVTLTKVEAEAAKKFTAAMRETKAAAEAVGQELLVALGPAFVEVLKELTKFVAKLREFVKEHPTVVNAITKIAVSITAAGGLIFAFGKATSVIGGVLIIAPKVVAAFESIKLAILAVRIALLGVTAGPLLLALGGIAIAIGLITLALKGTVDEAERAITVAKQGVEESPFQQEGARAFDTIAEAGLGDLFERRKEAGLGPLAPAGVKGEVPEVGTGGGEAVVDLERLNAELELIKTNLADVGMRFARFGDTEINLADHIASMKDELIEVGEPLQLDLDLLDQMALRIMEMGDLGPESIEKVSEEMGRLGEFGVAVSQEFMNLGSSAQNFALLAVNGLAAVGNGFGAVVQQGIMEGKIQLKDFGKVFKEVFAGIVASLVAAIVKLLAFKLLMSLIPGFGQLGGVLNIGSMLNFHEGGVVPGRPGQEVLSLVQGGERILTAPQNREFEQIVRGGGAAVNAPTPVTISTQFFMGTRAEAAEAARQITRFQDFNQTAVDL